MTVMIPKHILKYPTPLHIFYCKYLEEDALAVKEGLQKYLPNAELYYSTKTNALLELLKNMLSLGYGLEAIAPGDLHAAISAGAPGNKLIINGAAWNKAFLSEALFTHKVKRLHLDSFTQIELLTQILSENKNQACTTEFGIRINDKKSHFGFADDLGSLQTIAKKTFSQNIKISCLHIHQNTSGGQQSIEKSISIFRENFQKLLAAKIALEEFSHTPISCLDLGGGIETPFVYRPQGEELSDYHKGEIASAINRGRPSLKEQCEAISYSIQQEMKKLPKKNFTIAFEPGRSIATRSLSTILSIVTVKNELYPEAQIIITDGNTSILGPLHRGIHPIQSIPESPRVGKKQSFLYGNLPHSSDWLAQKIILPHLEKEDHILIENTGAYFLPLESNFGYAKPGIYDFEKEKMVREPENPTLLSSRDKI